MPEQIFHLALLAIVRAINHSNYVVHIDCSIFGVERGRKLVRTLFGHSFAVQSEQFVLHGKYAKGLFFQTNNDTSCVGT